MTCKKTQEKTNGLYIGRATLREMLCHFFPIAAQLSAHQWNCEGVISCFGKSMAYIDSSSISGVVHILNLSLPMIGSRSMEIISRSRYTDYRPAMNGTDTRLPLLTGILIHAPISVSNNFFQFRHLHNAAARRPVTVWKLQGQPA